MGKRLEFFVTPDGKVMYAEDGQPVKEYQERDCSLSKLMLQLIARQYPEALMALNQTYMASRMNKVHFDYLRVSRFIRCNFGKFDGLTYDVDDMVLHIEEVACPIKCECAMCGVICKPKPLGLTERETEIAKLISTGMSYKEVSEKLDISPSTIKNILQKIKEKLHLSSSKDIAKIFVAIL